MSNQCDECCFLTYDEEYDEYYCDVDMDEDDFYRAASHGGVCPYFRSGSAYDLSKKQ